MNEKNPRLESDSVRLIDANVLLENLVQEWNQTFRVLLNKNGTPSMRSIDENIKILELIERVIESAPTVETTDDVLDSIGLSNGLKVAVVSESTLGFKKSIAFRFDNDIRYPHSKPVEGKTPLEALKKLEASLNSK